MTRRRVLFVRKDGRRYITPEFNGDKTEFERREGCLDSCDMTWVEIATLFEKCKIMPDFIEANVYAQAAYHSFLDDEQKEIYVTRNVPRNRPLPSCDELLTVYEDDSVSAGSTNPPISLGMTVYLKDIRARKEHDSPIETLLTKVGSKFYTVDYHHWGLQFHKDSCLEKSDYSPSYQLFFSLAQYYEAEEHTNLVRKINSMGYTDIKKLSLEQLRAIDRIIQPPCDN